MIKIRKIIHKREGKPDMIEYAIGLPKKLVEAMGWDDGRTWMDISVTGKDRLELRRGEDEDRRRKAKEEDESN